MKVAVIDMGTNVFGVLWAEVEGGYPKQLKEFKCGARLFDTTVSGGVLTNRSYLSAANALKMILYFVESNTGADIIKAYATSAIRDAANGKEFAKNLGDHFGIEIEIISGEREAELIYKGGREAFFIWNENVLLMDIGGGSVEFIIADKSQVLWKRSFPLGMARMKEMFSPSDPITQQDIEAFTAYCDRELDPLKEQLLMYKPTLLAGSSGSFDTFRTLLFPGDIGIRIGDEGFVSSRELPLERMAKLNEVLIASTKQERLEMKGMSELRADFIGYASIFTHLVLKISGIKDVIQSSYSLKEGAMFEELEIRS